MRRKLLSILPLLALALVFRAEAVQSTANTTLAIKGMTCGGCVAAVKLLLKKTEGVTAYDVSLERREADVTCDLRGASRSV